MERLIKEKREAIASKKEAEERSNDNRRAREAAERQLGESTGKMAKFLKENEDLLEQIQQQKEAILKAHKEVAEVEKSRDYFNSQI